MARTAAYDRYAPLLAEYAGREGGERRRVGLRAQLVEAFTPVARNVARRFEGRGEPVEDLEQVAVIGLLRALERYDPDRGTDFLSFAIPNIMGEVRQHFRDATWVIAAPRSVKDLHLRVRSATTTLSQRSGRTPTERELAEHLQLSRDEVEEGLAAAGSYRPASLDRRIDTPADRTLLDVLSAPSGDLDVVDDRFLVGALLASLPAREHRMLVLRFVHEQTQYEIAATLCVSQMQVSRVLAKTFALLRERVRDWAEPDAVAS